MSMSQIHIRRTSQKWVDNAVVVTFKGSVVLPVPMERADSYNWLDGYVKSAKDANDILRKLVATKEV